MSMGHAAERPAQGCIWCLPRTEASSRAFTVVGNGEQTRDFTYVSDVADAAIVATSTLAGEAVNVGSGGTYSTKPLVKLPVGRKPIYRNGRVSRIKRLPM